MGRGDFCCAVECGEFFIEPERNVFVFLVVFEVVLTLDGHCAVPVERQIYMVELGYFRIDFLRPVVRRSGRAGRIVFYATAAEFFYKRLAVSKVGVAVNAEHHVGIYLIGKVLAA